MSELTARQEEYLDALPQPSYQAWADAVGASESSAEEMRRRLNDENDEIAIEKVDGEWLNTFGDADDPEREDLNERETYIYRSLPKSAAALADDLGIGEIVVDAHLQSIADKGWPLEDDGEGNYIALDHDTLRSSKHKTQITRQANEWWQRRHDELVHAFNGLKTPSARNIDADGSEDWVTHMTDLHAGDIVRRDDGRVVYETSEIPRVVDYITQQSLALADKHNSEYDTAHLLWGGDFITNEGIYEGQFENLDAWLDEQHDVLVDPLVSQIKAFADRFPRVQIVCQVGNHGNHRASGTSKQANADLVLYKTIRNTVAQIQKYGSDEFDNVDFVIGQAKPYRNFEMRGGKLKGHLRHGQHRKPQAETSARQNQWRSTLQDHDFDVAYMGHYHISGRIPWGGPPIFVTSSPKPAGEFVERIGGKVPNDYQGVATAHGVSDDGLTTSFPIDTRHYERETNRESQLRRANA